MDISLPADALIVVGLILDAVGIYLLFWHAPEKYPDPQSTAFFKLEDDSRERWLEKQATRRKISGFSVGIIILGFFLQCIAVVLW